MDIVSPFNIGRDQGCECCVVLGLSSSKSLFVHCLVLCMCFLTFSHSVLCCSCSSGGLSLSRYCSNGVLFAVTVNRVLVTDGVTLQAVSLTDGKVTWEQTLPDGVR